MSINRLFLVLILIAIYSVFAPAFKSDFLLKLSFTFFLWAAVAVSVINYLGSYQLIRSRFDRVGWRLMQLLLLLNLTIIARSLLTADAALTTALGNPYNALAFFCALCGRLRGSGKSSAHAQSLPSGVDDGRTGVVGYHFHARVE